jgi:hypothetical protein
VSDTGLCALGKAGSGILLQAVEANRKALQQFVSTGVGVTEKPMKMALANIRERLRQSYGSAAQLSLDSVVPHGVRDVIDSDRVGLVAPFGDASALAAHVISLLSDPERSRRIGDEGRRSVLARFGLDRLVDDVEQLYRELLY